jgi:hypothetical protein
MLRTHVPLRSALRILCKYFYYFSFCYSLWVATPALFLPALATAHESETKHLLLLQVEPKTLLALVVYEIPAGQAASVLRAMFDPDADAHLDPSQRAALAQKLSQDAVAGWVIRQDSKILAATSLDWRLDVDEDRPDGGLLLALKINFDGGGAGRYEVQQTRPPQSTGQISLEVEVVAPLTTSTAISSPQDPHALGPWALRGGDTLWFVVR